MVKAYNIQDVREQCCLLMFHVLLHIYTNICTRILLKSIGSNFGSWAQSGSCATSVLYSTILIAHIWLASTIKISGQENRN